MLSYSSSCSSQVPALVRVDRTVRHTPRVHHSTAQYSTVQYSGPQCPPPLPPAHLHCCCRYVHNYIKYEFDFRFDVPATYPAVAPEIELPELEGKTAKMYRGGKICLTIHFKPLWAKNR